VVYQDFTRVTKAIRDGEFFENPTICAAVDKAVAAGKAVHFMGLLSCGGVQSHQDHLVAMAELAFKRGADKIYLHAFLDGLDTPPKSAQSDDEVVYFPSNLIENLYLSNGMSAGNTLAEAQVQCLSEIFERAVKREIIEGEFALPDVPAEVLAKYPGILAGIQGLEAQGFPVLVKDASLGGEFPVVCVTLMNPRPGGVFASFGAHPSLEVALERSLTELLQGRSFEGLNDLPQPTFEGQAVTEPNNFVEHFIDSSGVVSWRFFSSQSDYEFVEWDFSGEGEDSNAQEAATLFGILEGMGKESYIDRKSVV